ncbi:MAG: methylenetetrahydrofolate reductase C-terminal domain-containing protein [Spirochaetales bacterium]|nr:methylenetetrahydrofolate reductase C-terminal domain-containing protein [Spirochaetales bacterium]
MITAEQKPFEEIYQSIRKYKKILLLGCDSCVAVCMAGGEKEVGILASLIRLANKKNNIDMEVKEASITRQCDREFFDTVKEEILWADGILSLACGVGVQFGSEVFDGKRMIPALNTKFYGATTAQGEWSARCVGCGECVLDKYGAICPIARCSKSMLNGPCGGSQNGMCEVDPENIDCGWQLIYDRLKKLDLLENLEEVESIKDWSTGKDGGPGKIEKEDMKL